MLDMSELNFCLQTINASIQSEDRRKRKHALTELRQHLLKFSANKDDFGQVFEQFERTLWKCLDDQSEAVRDLTIDLLQESLPNVLENNRHLDEIIPIIYFRLGGDQNLEPSEEIRLKLVELLRTLIIIHQKNIYAYIEDITQILSKTLEDSFFKVRQESMRCCKDISSISGIQLYDHGWKLVKQILRSFKHNHSRVRIGAIEALSLIMLEGNWKFLEAQEVFGSLGEKLFDTEFKVKLAIVELLGLWLVSLRERYSFFSRLVPLMLSCLVDGEEKVVNRAWEVWCAAGKQYIAENEQELKDKMDYLDSKPLHYPLNIKRPNIGCRTLVQRNTVQMTTPLFREISDWKVEIRVKSSALLLTLVLHAEEEFTQHTEDLLQAVYTVAERGDPPAVIENVEQAVEYLAFFVRPTTWHQLVHPILEDEVRLGHLRILSALCRGSESGDLSAYLLSLSSILAEPRVCTTREVLYQTQALKCCQALLNNVESVDERSQKNLFQCLYYVAALSGDLLKQPCQACIELLAEKCKTTVLDLTKQNVGLLTSNMKSTVDHWSAVHPDFQLLIHLFTQSASIWSPVLEDIKEILKSALKTEQDAALRNQLFIQLTQTLVVPDLEDVIGLTDFKVFLRFFIEGILLPNMIWRAGRTSEALRTTVLGCLSAILNIPTILKVSLPAAELTKQLLPQLIDCLKDAAPLTRLYTIKSLIIIIRLAAEQKELTVNHVNFVLEEVLGRLDDVSDEVRTSAVGCLKTIFSNTPSNYASECKAHLEIAMQVMLTHLDDPNPDFQQSIFDVLQDVVRCAPDVAKSQIEARRHQFSSQHLCDQLLQPISTNID